MTGSRHRRDLLDDPGAVSRQRYLPGVLGTHQRSTASRSTAVRHQPATMTAASSSGVVAAPCDAAGQGTAARPGWVVKLLDGGS
jgi:hypothetical protein